MQMMKNKKKADISQTKNRCDYYFANNAKLQVWQIGVVNILTE